MKPITRRPRAVLAVLAASTTFVALTTAPTALAEPLAADSGAVQAVQAAQAEPAAGLTESFDGPDLPPGWKPVEGAWKVQNGRLVGTSVTAGQQSRITFGTPLIDYRIESRVRFESALDGARWVAFGLDLAPSGAVPWSIATLRNGSTATNGLEFAQRTTSNTWNVTDTAAAPIQVGVGMEVTVAVEVRGSRATWYVDGRESLRTSMVNRTAGGAQAFLVNGATVSFDDLKVTPLGKESFIRKPGTPLRVWAHRGGSSASPENTAASDEVARRARAEWIENDVQPTKDDVPVILHDDTVDRTTDGTGAVRSLTAAQVGALDAGSWFAPAFAGQRVPTLASQLDGLKTRGGNLLLEVKGAHTRDSVARIVSEVRSRGMSSRVFVQSFEPQHLRWMHELAPELPLGLLRSTLDPDPVAIAKDLELSAYNPSDAALSARPGAIAELHAAGVAVNVWTVDDAARWDALEKAGVDGVITNRPAELAGWNAAFLQRAKPKVLTPAADAKVDRAQALRIAVSDASAQITLDGNPVENGAPVDTTTLTAGRHEIRVGDTVSAFEIVATPTGLASLILTSGASQAAVSTMTTLLGQRQYAVLATYASTPAAAGLSAVRRQQIVAEARALR
ncbi:glycerophosphoryl diester phosphodiesterase [Kribbella orskensis]|uniref:Glycerophosphoryl diester phosphodiesterase n=1 Tax=Kribbella orskensis TaxID=2512216 RepID=A0ABY2BFC1_9ACTN|nr:MULTISPECIES: glycerophosphodiester phosphodiesterase family protein [Kribbella]TCN37718.1 glycerophosphoryl diester phosphodiesterase [Kribbella sp. VKM Ac-2500]TCO18780.1 glycerophosphoryl diester phosphodiesterase [Kribbella orskensis]